MKNVVIVGCKRTPIGIFMGGLKSLTATNLGSIAIRGALATTRLENTEVEEVFMGQVLQAANGQAPATQAAVGAGLPSGTITTTINKGCASGMKAAILASQAIK
jgi:acetyl-CoA C-acetyltransferase